MKISEARQIYSTQINEYRQQYSLLSQQKKELEEKMESEKDGHIIYANEAATLELTMKAVDEKNNEYQKYMNQIMEQRSAIANIESAKQQGEAMADYAEDIGKIMEVARRIMNGDKVPNEDEKKLMEYSSELYQAAKNMGAMIQRKERKEYDSLWEEEEKETPEDPLEIADNAECSGSGPAVVPVADTIAEAAKTE